jgi:ATP adenylyltransferase
VYAVLNLYPYNAGHLLIVPFRHCPDITDLDAAEAAEFVLFTQRAVATVRAATTAHGFNLGMNLGAVAGAGIAAHLHQHVVPRWGGDLNFMPIIGHTRVLPQLLADTRQVLADAWPG